MIEIKYVSSNRSEYSLIGDKMRATSGTLHKYNWKPKTRELEYGEEVLGFEKDALTYEMTLTIRGTLEDRKEWLNDLRNAFEYDIANLMPGRIYFGNFYIDAYIISSKTETSDIINCWSKDEIEIYCPYPFWISEKKHVFKASEITSTGDKRYPGRYPNRYASGLTNAYIVNDHYTECDFKMVVYGRALKPQIYIGGYPYYVNTILEDGEYLEIDGVRSAVEKVMNTGLRINCFHNRDKKNNIFRELPPGKLEINWSGEFDFDLTLYEKRSEPKW